jgi:hypothetical protein
MIEIWYGGEQRFGHRGVPQRWINVLGRVDAERTAELEDMLRHGDPKGEQISA